MERVRSLRIQIYADVGFRAGDAAALLEGFGMETIFTPVPGGATVFGYRARSDR